MMGRRDFVKYLALIAAGATANPAAVAAFEHYYGMNVPADPRGPLACVDEIFLSGLATLSIPLDFQIKWSAGRFAVGINLFGGMMRWAAMPDQKIIDVASEIKWWMVLPEGMRDDAWVQRVFRGHISYIDSDGVRQYMNIDRLSGTVDPMSRLVRKENV